MNKEDDVDTRHGTVQTHRIHCFFFKVYTVRLTYTVFLLLYGLLIFQVRTVAPCAVKVFLSCGCWRRLPLEPWQNARQESSLVASSDREGCAVRPPSPPGTPQNHQTSPESRSDPQRLPRRHQRPPENPPCAPQRTPPQKKSKSTKQKHHEFFCWGVGVGTTKQI